MKFLDYLNESISIKVKQKLEKRKGKLTAVHFSVNGVDIAHAFIGNLALRQEGSLSWNEAGLQIVFGLSKDQISQHFKKEPIASGCAIYQEGMQKRLEKLIIDGIIKSPEPTKKEKPAGFRVIKRKSSGNILRDFEFVVNGIVIASYSQRKDYVKAKQTDRLRTKLATVHSFAWEPKGLRELFNDPSINTGRASSWSDRKIDFFDSYGQGVFRTGNIIDDLNDFSKRKNLGLVFR